MAPVGKLGHQNLPGPDIAFSYQHGHRLWSKIWPSIWVLVEAWSMNTNTDPGFIRAMHPDMVLGSSLARLSP